MKPLLFIAALAAGFWTWQQFDNPQGVIPIARGENAACFVKHQRLVAAGYMEHAQRLRAHEFKNERAALKAKDDMWLNADTLAFKPMDEKEQEVLGDGKYTEELAADFYEKLARDLDPHVK